MRTKTINSNSTNRIIIFVEIVLMVLIILMGYFTYLQSRPIKIDASKMDIVSDNARYYYSIDNVEKKNSGKRCYINVKGHVLEKNVEVKSSDTVKVVMRNMDSGEYYSIPTNRFIDYGITQMFYDGTNYDECGFLGEVMLDEEFNTDLHDYELLIYYKNTTGEKMIKSGVTFNQMISKE